MLFSFTTDILKHFIYLTTFIDQLRYSLLSTVSTILVGVGVENEHLIPNKVETYEFQESNLGKCNFS